MANGEKREGEKGSRGERGANFLINKLESEK